MTISAQWVFGQLKGSDDVIRAVEWTIRWTDTDFPGTTILSSGMTTEGIELPVATSSKQDVEIAVIKSLGSQLQAIRNHAAELMPIRHQWENLQVIDAPDIVTPPQAE